MLYDSRGTVCKLFKSGSGLCAVVEGVPIGYVLFSSSEGEVREISMVEVHPWFRSRGVGGELLEAAQLRLRTAGARCLTIECTGPEGEALARACGFAGPASEHGPGRPYKKLCLQKPLGGRHPPVRSPRD